MSSITTVSPAFGAAIPGQGGMLAAILRGPTVDGIEQPPFALLVSDAAAGEFDDIEWGNFGADVPGTNSRTDGQANTAAMALASCPAALHMRGLTIDGHSDWYLPSVGELNSAATNAPELFSAIGYYWTSTQGSRHTASVHDFECGYSLWYDKGYLHKVRGFRRISLALLASDQTGDMAAHEHQDDADETLPCDFCGNQIDPDTAHHFSGLLNGVFSRHIHLCDAHAKGLPTVVVEENGISTPPATVE